MEKRTLTTLVYLRNMEQYAPFSDKTLTSDKIIGKLCVFTWLCFIPVPWGTCLKLLDLPLVLLNSVGRLLFLSIPWQNINICPTGISEIYLKILASGNIVFPTTQEWS